MFFVSSVFSYFAEEGGVLMFMCRYVYECLFVLVCWPYQSDPQHCGENVVSYHANCESSVFCMFVCVK